jgi:hypothetical protein
MASSPEKIEQLAIQLKKLSDTLAKEKTSSLPANRTGKILKTINEVYDRLRSVIDDLDPVKQPEYIFDPSNPAVVGRIVGITMIAQKRSPLSCIERFYGSGVYAIYYSGDFPAYAPLAKKEHPIYVGKADPSDPASKTAIQQGEKLSKRLSEHQKNITKATSSLRIEDFEYRALVVQTGWQTAAEDYLIDLFKPIWNSEIGICYGFGKHGDNPDTRRNLRSPWDTLHPGREWAHRDSNMKDAKAKDQIFKEIHQHLTNHAPVASIDGILRHFLEDIRVTK